MRRRPLLTPACPFWKTSLALGVAGALALGSGPVAAQSTSSTLRAGQNARAAAGPPTARSASAVNRSGTAGDSSSVVPSRPQATRVTPPAGLAGWTNRLEHARDLAARGAVHAAESEFREVLTDFANANDVQTGTGEHLQRLSAGWLALHEAEDFYRLMSSLNPTHDLARVIETHRTTVLSSAAPDRLTPPIAVQAYHAFARRSFVQALSDSGGATGATSGGRAGLAADGLYGLARIQHSLVASSRNRPDSAATANSITLLQAALAIAPRHAESANELGVLMARLGRNEEASQLFEQALAVKPSAELWHNYAAVLSQLGKESEATAARQQHERLQAAATRSGTTRGTAANAPDIRWVSLEEFAEAGPAPVEHAKATSQDGAAVHRTPEGPAAPGTAGTPSVRPTRSLFRWLRPGSS